MAHHKDKKKKRIKGMTFDYEGAHVALVSKTLNGGPANEWDVLLTKGVNDISEEDLNKAHEVSVDMSFEEFLRKFFNMYYSDSQALARLLGYEIESDVEVAENYSDYIDERIEGITLLKGAFGSDDVNKFLTELDSSQIVQLLKTQQEFEELSDKFFPDNELPDEVLTKSEEEDNQLGENSEMNLEELMKSAEFETLMAEKLEKAKEEGKAEAQAETEAALADLAKAKEEVEELRKEKEEAKVAARKDRLEKAVGEEKAESLVKSLESLDDEAFDTVVKGFEDQAAAAEESDLTKEVGVGGEGTADEEDPTARLLREKYAK